MKLPTQQQIEQLSADFDFCFPASYRRFVNAPEPEAIKALNERLPNGWFLTSSHELGAIRDVIGPSLVPFFLRGTQESIASVLASDFDMSSKIQLYCFDLDCDPIDEEYEVSAFSIHTVVAQWPDFSDWLAWLKSGTGWREWIDQDHRPRSWDA